MSERPVFFRNIADTTNRPDFDPECGITVTTFRSIVGEYQFDEDVACQIMRDGKHCKQAHRHGWLGKLQDGKEGYIGSHCGSKYFNANDLFIGERARVTRELRLDDYVNRLTAILSDASYRQRVETTESRVRFLRESLLEIQERLPDSVNARLKDMAKTGSATVSVEIRYQDEDEKDKEKIVSIWESRIVGTIQGTAIWQYDRIGSIFTRLSAIKTKLAEALAERAQGPRRLKAWLDVFDELPRCESDAEEAQAALDQFQDPTNLQMLCFSIANHDHRLALARMCLERSGHRDPSMNQQRALIKELDSAIKQQYGNRDLRIR